MFSRLTGTLVSLILYFLPISIYIALRVIPRSDCSVWQDINCKCYSIKYRYMALPLTRSLKPKYSPRSSFVPSSFLFQIICKLEVVPKIFFFLFSLVTRRLFPLKGLFGFKTVVLCPFALYLMMKLKLWNICLFFAIGHG